RRTMSERVERVLGREREGAAAWAGREVGAAALGDARVGARLGQLATQVGAPPPSPARRCPRRGATPPAPSRRHTASSLIRRWRERRWWRATWWRRTGGWQRRRRC